MSISSNIAFKSLHFKDKAMHHSVGAFERTLPDLEQLGLKCEMVEDGRFVAYDVTGTPAQEKAGYDLLIKKEVPEDTLQLNTSDMNVRPSSTNNMLPGPIKGEDRAFSAKDELVKYVLALLASGGNVSQTPPKG